MSVAKELYRLQEIDLEIESKEEALQQLVSQLGESQTVLRTQSKLTSEQQQLEILEQQQHNLEWQIDDLAEKIATLEKKLFSGAIKNPKELTNLQHEADIFKTKRSQLEDEALEIMGQVEQSTASVAAIGNELKKLEAEWRSQQQQLSNEIEQLKTALATLKQKREILSANVEAGVIELYDELRKQRGTAVAKVEQGMCRGCRISLPTTDLQRARTGNLTQCSSCGRILFFA